MKLDTRTLAPWADVNTILSRMSTRAVHIGDEVYEGEAELTRDEGTGHVVLKFEARSVEKAAPRKPKKAAA